MPETAFRLAASAWKTLSPERPGEQFPSLPQGACGNASISVSAQTIRFAAVFLGWPSRAALALRRCGLDSRRRNWRRGKIFIKKLGLGCRTPPLSRSQYLVDEDAPVQRNGQYVADLYLIRSLFDLVAIDPDLAADGEFRRQRS